MEISVKRRPELHKISLSCRHKNGKTGFYFSDIK